MEVNFFITISGKWSSSKVDTPRL